MKDNVPEEYYAMFEDVTFDVPPNWRQEIDAPYSDAWSELVRQHPATWNYHANATGWGSLIWDAVGRKDVSPCAAAARANGLSAFLIVPELDGFRDETIDHAKCVAQGYDRVFS